MVTKIGAFLAAVRVQSKQLGIHRSDVHDFLSRLVRAVLVRRPVSYAAGLDRRLSQGFELCMRIDHPFYVARSLIQLEDTIKRRADLQRIVRKLRRRRPDGWRYVAATI